MEYYFSKEKTIDVIKSIKKEFENQKSKIEAAIELNKNEWDIDYDFSKFIDIFDLFIKNKKEYLPKFSKEKIVNGYGKILLYETKQNPYIILDFILSAIYTNNKVTVAIQNKNLAVNKVIIEVILKALKDIKLTENGIVDYLEVKETSTVVLVQDEFDLIYYFGNKEEYIAFSKRLHVDSKFENSSEIYVFVDENKFKDLVLSLNMYAIDNQIELRMFSGSLDENLIKMNKINNVSKVSIIYTEDLDKAYEFIKKIKTEEVFINLTDFTRLQRNFDLSNLVYTKKINIK